MTQTIQTERTNGSFPVIPFERAKPRYVPGRRHVLDMDDFSRQEIEDTFQNADAMRDVMNREIKKVPHAEGQNGHHAVHGGEHAHARFVRAGGQDTERGRHQRLRFGAAAWEKGESLYNTALTLQAMNADIIIIRHSHSGAPHFLARHLDACVINAGDGAHAHPTQALLDLYTMRNYFGRVEGLKVAIIGDILYSRVARSNLWGLTAMGADVTLCAPRTLLPQDLLDHRTRVEGHPFADVRIVTDVESALKGADVVYALRLQLERQQAGHLPSLREYSRRIRDQPRAAQAYQSRRR